MIKTEYKYGGSTLYITDMDPVVMNTLKHWSKALNISVPLLAKLILTNSAEKKMKGLIKIDPKWKG